MDAPRRSATRRAPPPIDVSKARPYSSSAHVRVQAHGTEDDPTQSPLKESSLAQRPGKFTRAFSIIAEPSNRPLIDTTGCRSQTTRAPRKSWAYPRRSSQKTSPCPAECRQSPPPTSTPQYYRDGEARLRLKDYLGSPKGFEDVLEHGYPPMADVNARFPLIRDASVHSPRTPVARSSAPNNDAPKFLRSDVISWLDNGSDDDSDSDDGLVDDDNSTLGGRSALSEFDIDDYLDDSAERSSVEVGSPLTPRDVAVPVRPSRQRYQRPANAGTSSGHCPSKNRPSTCYDRPSDYTSPVSPTSPIWPGARDMTLRMTLTRPELRSPEEQLFHTRSGSSTVGGDSPPRQISGATDTSSSGGRAERAARREGGGGRGRSHSIWRKMSLVGNKR